MALTPETLFDVTDTEGGVSVVYNDIEGGDINIPAQIGGKTVTEIGRRAFFCIGITSVIIPEGVTEIGYAAFKDCARLSLVSLPDSLASLWEEAFIDSENVTVTYKGTAYTYEELDALYSAVKGE